MNKFYQNKIDITVLVTSLKQRETTIETANYYSEICSEVVIVDEQEPYLCSSDIKSLKEAGITYIPYTYRGDANKKSLHSTYEKRLIAASQSKNKYVVHSNHDERYTYYGLLACMSELENNKNLTFCAGQAVAVRRDNSGIHYSRPHKNLYGYQNINNINQRLYYHAETYALVAHYSVWIKESYINVTEKTISIHDLMPSTTMMEEVIFELAADLAGNSKAIPELYWIRNRLNPPLHNSNGKGKHVFKTIENKLHLLLSELDDIKIHIIINSFWNHFTFVHPSFLSRSIISIKLIARKVIKKKKINDIFTLLNNANINYNKDDLSNVFKSMGL